MTEEAMQKLTIAAQSTGCSEDMIDFASQGIEVGRAAEVSGAERSSFVGSNGHEPLAGC
jgi:hypothetical protein